jgi:hypothetical protein
VTARAWLGVAGVAAIAGLFVAWRATRGAPGPAAATAESGPALIVPTGTPATPPPLAAQLGVEGDGAVAAGRQLLRPRGATPAEDDPDEGIGEEASPEVTTALLGALAPFNEAARPCLHRASADVEVEYRVTFDVDGGRGTVQVVEVLAPLEDPMLACLQERLASIPEVPLAVPDGMVPVTVAATVAELRDGG